MNVEQLRHILRAAAAVTGEKVFIVIGSQAILGSHPDAPRSLRRSIEGTPTPKTIQTRQLTWMGPLASFRHFIINSVTTLTVCLPKQPYYPVDGSSDWWNCKSTTHPGQLAYAWTNTTLHSANSPQDGKKTWNTFENCSSIN